MADVDDVRVCQAGNPDGFRNLIARYQGPLLKHLSGKLADGSDVAEAAQETLVRAFAGLRRLRQTDSFLAWLLGIADRVVLEMYRSRARSGNQLQPELIAAQENSSPPLGRHTDEQLALAIAKLPEVYRQVIQRRFFGRQSCVDVGLELGVSTGTVTSRLSRAYVLLRQLLQEMELEDL